MSIAEDMEYDACLTVAASDKDSLKRIAFVGAFAMSNYSSTIGRIAKPFNPLLSQSFEYAIPNRYRYISEQVSHHPVSLLQTLSTKLIYSPLPLATVKHPSGSTLEKLMLRTNSRGEVSRSDRLEWLMLSL
jgi:hypothetical protein